MTAAGLTPRGATGVCEDPGSEVVGCEELLGKVEDDEGIEDDTSLLELEELEELEVGSTPSTKTG
jgi:hypothetical protein